MRTLKSLSALALLIGLATPAFAQIDPHHPEGTDAPVPTEEVAPTDESDVPTPPVSDTAVAQCPDMMGMMAMMQNGRAGKPDMPIMQMQMMQVMQQMQVMQMQLMQLMQQMPADPMLDDAPAEEPSP